MIENLSFDQLPNAVTMLTKEVSELKNFLLQKQDDSKREQAEKLFSVKETAEFLNLSVPTIYSKVSRNEIPYMKRGKRLYFSNLELLNYLKDGRVKTNLDIEIEANIYLSTNS
jgi:excisionase family DNA binding protein